jgi:hypothetical protein
MRKQLYIQIAGAAALVCCGAQATNYKVPNSSVRAPEALGNVKLFHNDKNGFSVFAHGKKHSIDKASVDADLRSVNNKQLKAFSKAGYLSVNQYSDGSFGLKKNVRGNGGGFFTAFVAYAAVKATEYAMYFTYPTSVDNQGTAMMMDAAAKAAFMAGLATPLP